MILVDKNAVLLFNGLGDIGGGFCDYGVVGGGGGLYSKRYRFDSLTNFVNMTKEEMEQLDKALCCLYKNGCLNKDFLIDKKNNLTAQQIVDITEMFKELQPLGAKLSTIKITLCHEKECSRCYPVSRLFNIITEVLSKESTVDKTQFYQIDPKIKQILDDLSQALQPFSNNNISPAKQCITHIEALATQIITQDDFRSLCDKTIKTSEKQTIDDAVVNAIVQVMRAFLRVFDILYASASGTQKKNDDLTRHPFLTFRPHKEITRRYQIALEKLEALNVYEGITNKR